MKPRPIAIGIEEYRDLSDVGAIPTEQLHGRNGGRKDQEI